MSLQHANKWTPKITYLISQNTQIWLTCVFIFKWYVASFHCAMLCLSRLRNLVMIYSLLTHLSSLWWELLWTVTSFYARRSMRYMCLADPLNLTHHWPLFNPDYNFSTRLDHDHWLWYNGRLRSFSKQTVAWSIKLDCYFFMQEDIDHRSIHHKWSRSIRKLHWWTSTFCNIVF